ncbi:hypothetical protein [Acinetobacter guillouiae]|nr:hypothetical protein [Acinetobacter guillouiae]MBP2544654.1 hypothetical protein [Acinetobacter guillouiae]
MRDITFKLSEDNYHVINEVCITLKIMASMGLFNTYNSCNDPQKTA